MTLPDAIIEVLTVFRPLVTAQTWRKLMILLSGTLLAQGRRTVAVALRFTGNEMAGNWSNFHQVLSPRPLVSFSGEPSTPPADRQDLCARRG